MNRLRVARLTLAAFFVATGSAATFDAAARPTPPPPCVTKAQLGQDGKYYITCDIEAACDDGLCDFMDNQVGGSHYHYCRCSDGSNSQGCNGWMLSNNPDPEVGGQDVGCFTPSSCPGTQICDGNQLTGTYQVLCECKQL